MLYQPLAPDVVLTSHSSLYKQTELVATSDFFLSVAVTQMPASGHLDAAWSWLMSPGPVLVVPQQRFAVPQDSPVARWQQLLRLTFLPGQRHVLLVVESQRQPSPGSLH